MFRYLLLLGLALALAVACSPSPSEDANVQRQETDEMAAEATESEDDHDGDHDETDEHGEDEDEDAHREHGAHEHGVATLTIAWSGSELAIDLETPAYNVLGFEYAPSSEEEQRLLNESVAALETGDLLQLSPEAGCSLTSAVVETALTEEAHEDDEHEAEESHSDINVAYGVQCQNPDELESLDASALFTRFPNFEALQVQWISDTQQSADELTPDNPFVSFR